MSKYWARSNYWPITSYDDRKYSTRPNMSLSWIYYKIMTATYIGLDTQQELDLNQVMTTTNIGLSPIRIGSKSSYDKNNSSQLISTEMIFDP